METRASYVQMSRPSRCSLPQEEFMFGEHPSKLLNSIPGSDSASLSLEFSFRKFLCYIHKISRF
jgi:hypothetical protein